MGRGREHVGLEPGLQPGLDAGDGGSADDLDKQTFYKEVCGVAFGPSAWAKNATGNSGKGRNPCPVQETPAPLGSLFPAFKPRSSMYAHATGGRRMWPRVVRGGYG